MKSENKVSFELGKSNSIIIKYIKITLVHQAGYSAFPHLPAAPELIAAKVWPSISPSLFVFPLMYKGPPSSPLHGPYTNQIKIQIKKQIKSNQIKSNQIKNQIKSTQLKLMNGIKDHNVVRTYCMNICLVVINSSCA